MNGKSSSEAIAEIISKERFEITSKTISERMLTCYYNTNSASERIHTIPEAFFTTFKNISENEILDILEKYDIHAIDGSFKNNHTGDIATYKDVLSNVLSSNNIENYTARFLKDTIGNIASQQYLGNTKNQKIVAEKILTEHFKNSKITRDFDKELEEKGLLNIATRMLNVHGYPVLIKIPERYKNVNNVQNIGLPYFALVVDNVVADFSSCAEIRHMLKDPVVLARIEKAVDYELVVKPAQIRKTRYEI